MDERCVAIYDSGAGGLCLLKKLVEKYPYENFVYFSDHENFPYGNKDKERLLALAKKNVNTIMSFCPKEIIFACNTLSTAALSEYSNFCVKVSGVLPFVPSGEKTLLLCTSATAASERVRSLKAENADIFVAVMDGLADEIEEWIRGGNKPDVYRRLSGLKKDYECVSLGCTHYTHLKEDIKRIFPKSRVVGGEDVFSEGFQGRMTTSENKSKKGEVLFLDKAYE
ncbi:MAG: aspartate/glutamate racemase family protein, partial [Clostridia bacterium]|nr:aspartate/glutamate racemase family protein [Clostridia bacterium]